MKLFRKLDHRHLTEPGKWLLPECRDLWPNYTTFHRETGIFASAILPYFTGLKFHPRIEFLRRFAEAFTRARQARGKPPITTEDLVARRFGSGILFHEWRAASAVPRISPRVRRQDRSEKVVADSPKPKPVPRNPALREWGYTPPTGSKEAEIVDAMRREIDARSARKVARITG